MTNYDRTAQLLIRSLDLGLNTWDDRIHNLERELADLRRQKAAADAERAERLALLEHLGYATRQDDGEYIITTPKIEAAA